MSTDEIAFESFELYICLRLMNHNFCSFDISYNHKFEWWIIWTFARKEKNVIYGDLEFPYSPYNSTLLILGQCGSKSNLKK